MNKLSIYLLMLFGEILLCFVSFLFLKDITSTDFFALNTAVLSIVYFLLFATFFDLFNTIKNDDSSTSSLGLTWNGILIYSVLAVGVGVASYVYKWEILTSVLLQLVALFVLLLFIILGNLAKSTVKVEMKRVNSRKESLKNAVAQLEALNIEVKINKSKSHKSQHVDMLKEHMRHITYSDNPTAVDLDRKLSMTFKNMLTVIADDENWMRYVERCETLIKLRKQIL